MDDLVHGGKPVAPYFAQRLQRNIEPDLLAILFTAARRGASVVAPV
jgi:hypothetical protein